MASALELYLLAEAGAAEPAWSGITLSSSWSAYGAGTVAPQYRYWASSNVAEVIGTISHASTSGSSTFCSAGISTYRPASQQSAAAVEVVLTSLVQLVFTTAGLLEFVGMPASSTVVSFHAYFPLDA
jgi:hypothetical protein